LALAGKSVGKIPNFDSFGAIVRHFCTNEVEIWQGEPTLGPSLALNFTLIGTGLWFYGLQNHQNLEFFSIFLL